MGSRQYEFRIRGRLGDTFLATFEDFDAEVEPVETILRGTVADQAELHGILERIQDLGLELVEVRRVGVRSEPIARENFRNLIRRVSSSRLRGEPAKLEGKRDSAPCRADQRRISGSQSSSLRR